MPREITCPGCRSAYKIPENLQGKPLRFKCKKCDRALTVAAGNGKPAGGIKRTPDDDRPVSRPKTGKSSRRPEPQEKSSAVLLVVLLLGVLLVGGGVGAYFLFIREKDDAGPVAQNDNRMPVLPGKDDQQKIADEMRDLLKQVDDLSQKKTDGPPPKKENPPVTDPIKDPPVKNPPSEEPKKEPPVPALYTLKDSPTPPASLTLEQPAHHIALRPDGNTAVIATDDHLPDTRNLVIIELPSGKTLKKIPVKEVYAHGLALTPDGKTAIVGGADDRFNVPEKVYIRLVNLETGEVGTLRGPKQGVSALALSRDGALLAFGEANFPPPGNTVRVIDVKTGTERFAREKAHTSLVKAVAISPDNKYVVSTGIDAGKSQCKVIVWDIAAGKEKHVWTGFPGMAEGLAVSGDGKWVAAAINAGLGGSLRVWNIETGEEKLALIGKSNGSRNVVFGPEDKTVIGIFYDNSTRVFELQTGQELGGVRGHSTAPSYLALTPDGKRLITVFYKELRQWEFPGSLANLARPDRPLVTVVLDGQAAPEKPVPPKDDPPGKTIANAVVASYIAGDHVQVTADGANSRVGLRPASKFLDATGTELPAAQAGKVMRPGNVVTIKSRAEFGGDAVVEMRLVREGPAEQVLEKAMVTELGPKNATFKTDDKLVAVTFDSAIRLINADGQEVQGTPPNKFLGAFPPKPYRITLKYAEGSGTPLLTEARELSAGPVTEVKPQDRPDAVTIKSAFVKRINIEQGGTSLALVEVGKPPLPITVGPQTKAYNMDGKLVSWRDVLKEGAEVSAVCVPRPMMHLALELRQISAGEPPPTVPEKKSTIEHKNVEVIRFKGNSQVFIKIGRRSHQIVIDASTKALDRAGQPVVLDLLLQGGNRVDVILEPTNQANRYLVVEIRQAGGR